DTAEAAVPIPSRRSRWLVGVLCAMIAALAGLAAIEWQSNRPGKGALHSGPTLILPFSALIEDTKDTYIVTSDSSLVLIQDLRRRQISLDDSIAGRYMVDTAVPASDPVRQEL